MRLFFWFYVQWFAIVLQFSMQLIAHSVFSLLTHCFFERILHKSFENACEPFIRCSGRDLPWIFHLFPTSTVLQCFTGDRGGPPSKVQDRCNWNCVDANAHGKLDCFPWCFSVIPCSWMFVRSCAVPCLPVLPRTMLGVWLGPKVRISDSIKMWSLYYYSM